MPLFANRKIGGVRVPCIAFYIVAVMVIVLYGAFIRKHGFKDILEKKVVDHPSCPGFDGWAVLHFFFFGMLGFLYPDHYIQALAVSLGWETIEHTLGMNKIEMSGKRLQLIGEQDAEGRPIKSDESWWYGRFVTDNSFNLSGYIIGSALGRRYWPNPL